MITPSLARLASRMTPPVAAHLFLTARAAVRLEALGMRHSSGRSARAHWARLLGLRPRAAHELVAAELLRIALNVMAGAWPLRPTAPARERALASALDWNTEESS